MNRVIIIYSSMSGNTEEVANLIGDTLRKLKPETSVEEYDIGLYEMGALRLPALSDYDYVFFGSYTWDKGSTPPEVKDFIADLGYKPDNVYVFGTGDTQFGGEALFCRAAKRLCTFFNSNVSPLLIEQSPRGSQEKYVREWTKLIIEGDR